MTEEQVDRIVEHLCHTLQLAIRLRGSQAHPPNAREIALEHSSVRTCAYRKSHPAILMVKSAEDRAADDIPNPLDAARDRGILVQ
jgi:hypothetical protein